MTAQVLQALRSDGLTIRLHEVDDLLIVQPAELLTDEHRKAIRANRDAIVAELRREDAATGLLARRREWCQTIRELCALRPDVDAAHQGDLIADFDALTAEERAAWLQVWRVEIATLTAARDRRNMKLN